MTYLYNPPYTDVQRAFFRQFMGYSKLFKSSNSIFENILDLIESVPAFDDGATFNQTMVLQTLIIGIDTQLQINSQLGLGTEITAEIKFDAYRNDRMLRMIGRNYIKKLSIIFSMLPAHDFFGRAQISLSGNTSDGATGTMLPYEF